MLKKHREQRTSIKDRENKRTHPRMDRMLSSDRRHFEKNEVRYSYYINSPHNTQIFIYTSLEATKYLLKQSVYTIYFTFQSPMS